MVLTATALNAHGRTALSAAAVHVDAQGQLLTVDVRNVPLVEVLRLIGTRAGVRMIMRGDLSLPITESFKSLPLDEGIQRLVHGFSLVFSYSPAGEEGGADALTEVWVMGSSRAEAEETPVRAEEPATGLRALRALAHPGDKAAAADLARILSSDADPIVRTLAAAALGGVGTEEVATALATALSDQTPSVRIQAVRALGKVEGPRAVQTLGGVLVDDPDPHVRRAAARALATLESEEARWALEAAASDPDESVRREAAVVLARWQGQGRGSRAPSSRVQAP